MGLEREGFFLFFFLSRGRRYGEIGLGRKGDKRSERMPGEDEGEKKKVK